MKLLLLLSLVLVACTRAETNAVPKPGQYRRWRGPFGAIHLTNDEWRSNFFKEVSIDHADFGGAKFPMLSIWQSVIRDSDLKGVDFRGSNIRNSSFANSDMTATGFRGAFLRSVNLRSARLQNADFRDSTLVFLSFEEADLSGANFEGARLMACRFEGAKFDDRTRLPFSKETALQYHMIEVKR